MMIRLICVAIGYVFGLFQTSYIYGKMHGIDIRTQGGCWAKRPVPLPFWETR